MNSPTSYAASPKPVTDRETMILQYYPIVRAIAHKVAVRFPGMVDVNDLISYGLLGLIDAIDRYDGDREGSFKAYVNTRIRGAIIDELRSQDWIARSARKRLQGLETVRRDLERNLGRAPNDSEVAREMGVSLEEYHRLARKSRLPTMVGLEDLSSKDDNKRNILEVLHGSSDTPERLLESRGSAERVNAAIQELPARHREVISAYYYDDLTLKQIGEKLELTESRISQIHTEAVDRLRKKLKRHGLT